MDQRVIQSPKAQLAPLKRPSSRNSGANNNNNNSFIPPSFPVHSPPVHITPSEELEVSKPEKKIKQLPEWCIHFSEVTNIKLVMQTPLMQVKTGVFRSLPVVVKEFVEGTPMPTEFLLMARRMWELRHPNVVTVIGVLVDSKRYPLGLVVEKTDQTLASFFSDPLLKMGFRDIVDVLYDTALALQYLHVEGIVHRDLRAEKIVFTQGYNIKLDDGGYVDLLCGKDALLPPAALSQAPPLHHVAPEAIDLAWRGGGAIMASLTTTSPGGNKGKGGESAKELVVQRELDRVLSPALDMYSYGILIFNICHESFKAGGVGTNNNNNSSGQKEGEDSDDDIELDEEGRAKSRESMGRKEKKEFIDPSPNLKNFKERSLKNSGHDMEDDEDDRVVAQSVKSSRSSKRSKFGVTGMGKAMSIADTKREIEKRKLKEKIRATLLIDEELAAFGISCTSSNPDLRPTIDDAVRFFQKLKNYDRYQLAVTWLRMSPQALVVMSQAKQTIVDGISKELVEEKKKTRELEIKLIQEEKQRDLAVKERTIKIDTEKTEIQLSLDQEKLDHMQTKAQLEIVEAHLVQKEKELQFLRQEYQSTMEIKAKREDEIDFLRGKVLSKERALNVVQVKEKRAQQTVEIEARRRESSDSALKRLREEMRQNVQLMKTTQAEVRKLEVTLGECREEKKLTEAVIRRKDAELDEVKNAAVIARKEANLLRERLRDIEKDRDEAVSTFRLLVEKIAVLSQASSKLLLLPTSSRDPQTLQATENALSTLRVAFDGMEFLDLSLNLEADQVLRFASSFCTNLQSLRCAYRPDVEDASFAALVASCSRLKSLDIAGCREVTRGVDALRLSGGKLRTLDISGLKNILDDSFSNVLKTTTCLTNLNVSGCPQVSDDSLSYLSGLVGLKFLDVSLTKCGDGALLSLATGCTRLEEIALDGCGKISDSGILAFSKICKGIRKFRIGGAVEVTDASAMAIAERFSALTDLTIARCRIGNLGVLSVLQSCCFVKSLNFDGALIGNRVANVLPAVSCGSRLTSLSLFHCKSTGSVPPPRTYEKGQVNESDDDDTDDEEDREFLKKRKEEREKAAEEERKRKEAAENADAAILENGGAPAASATSEKEAISSLIFSGMDNQGFSLIAKACVQLTFLDVGMNGGVDDYAVDMITRNCSYLQNLRLSHNRQLSPAIGKMLARLTSLTSLHLAGCVLMDDDVLVALADGCQGLTDLDISDCTLIRDPGITILSSQCHSLRRLLFSRDERIGDNAMKSLALSCQYLTELDASNCIRIGDNSLALLVNACKGLKKMILKGCGLITDRGATAIAGGCAELRELDVHATKITSSGLRAIGKSCRFLSLFDISATEGATETTVRSLEMMLPGCILRS